MSSTYTAIDLSQLPAPDVVEPLSFEAIFSEMLADLQARDPVFSALVESDPAFKILEVCAYRELIIRQRVNDAARATMLAYATGADLDQIGALFGVRRLFTDPNAALRTSFFSFPGFAYEQLPVGTRFADATNETDLDLIFEVTAVTPYFHPNYLPFISLHKLSLKRVSDGTGVFLPGDDPVFPPLPWPDPLPRVTGYFYGPDNRMLFSDEMPVAENDTDFRRRIQLALEGFSTAGPEGAYVFWALSADAEILDVSATSPEPGEVLITVMSRYGSGSTGSLLIEKVEDTLNAESRRPLTDHVTVQSAEIVEFHVTAEVYVYPGPDSSLVINKARAALDAYLASVHRLGRDVSISGIYAALHQPGVQRVNLIEPATDIEVEPHEASWCAGVNIIPGGTDE